MSTSSANPNPLMRWLFNTLIATGAFLLVDLVFFIVWKSPNPYFYQFLEKLVYTVVFAAIYAHIYDKASQEFKISNVKVINGLVFSFLFYIMLLAAVGLVMWLGVTVYIYILQGFHGELSSAELQDTVETGTQIIVAGGSLSLIGKTEDNPR